MQRTFFIVVILGFACIHLTSASPIWDFPLVSRQAPNCNDLGAPFNESCWGTLKLSAWLDNWNKTTPVCTGSQDGAACCESNEAWTTCFLRLAHGTPGRDCSQINPQYCSYTGNLSPKLDPGIVSQVSYVVQNIYAVNDFYTTWFEALAFASSQAAAIIQPVINHIDPDKKTNMILSEILTALTVGLAVLGVPELGVGLLGLAGGTKTIAETLIVGLQQAPGVAKAIWPVGTESSKSIQIGDLETELSTLVNDTSHSINAGLQLLMSDMPSFIGFASTGAFSGATPPSLPAQTEGLDMALRTYIVSSAMSHNNWQVYGAYNTSDGGSGKTNDSLTELSGLKVDSNSIAKDYDMWYSQSTNRIFLAGTQNKAKLGVGGQLMEDIVSNNWGTLPLLFDNGFDCTWSGNNLKGQSNLINFKPDGTVGFSCISQAWFCIYDGFSCPTDEVDGKCPFGTCGKLE